MPEEKVIIVEKINEILNLHKSAPAFQCSLEDAVFCFTNAYDSFVLDVFAETAQTGKTDDSVLDQIRQSYQMCIRLAFEHCTRAEAPLFVTKEKCLSFGKELEYIRKRNFMRNIFDRYFLGAFDAEIKDDLLHFSLKQDNRRAIYDFYSRGFQHKMVGAQDDQTRDTTTDTLKYIAMHTKDIHQNIQSKKLLKPNKLFLSYGYSLGENVLKNNFHLPDQLSLSSYTVNDFSSVYAFLFSLAINKLSFHFRCRLLNTTIEELFMPSVCYEKQTLIDDIAAFTSIELTKIENILKDLTYDPNFHKDKLSIYQPLFSFGDKIFFSGFLLSLSLPLDKLFYVFSKTESEKKALSEIAHHNETIMTNRLINTIGSSFSNIEAKKNCILRVGGKPKAEIDIVLLDHHQKTCILCELKWLQKNDNDKEAFYRESKISDFSKDRKTKEKLLQENFWVFLKQNGFMDNIKGYETHSVLISKDFSGGCFIDEAIPVVDEALFEHSIFVCKGDLKKTFAYLQNGDFYDELEAGLKLAHEGTYEYRGEKIVVKY